MKQCAKCQRRFPESHFYKNGEKRSPWCPKCHAQENKETRRIRVAWYTQLLFKNPSFLHDPDKRSIVKQVPWKDRPAAQGPCKICGKLKANSEMSYQRFEAAAKRQHSICETCYYSQEEHPYYRLYVRE